MKIRTAAAYASFFFVVYRLFKKVTEAKIKVKTTVLEKAFLESLLTQKNFAALLFNHEYDNRYLAKDQVSLVAYISDTDTGKPMQRMTLDSIEDDKPFDNELDYSIYRLEREDIQKILDAGPEPEVNKFLLEPIVFSSDNKFLAYNIIPADRFKNPIHFHRKVFRKEFAMAAADTFGAVEEDGSSDDFGKRGGLGMQPSPPARSNLGEV